jgi:hypothetical protein
VSSVSRLEQGRVCRAETDGYGAHSLGHGTGRYGRKTRLTYQAKQE